MAAAAVLVVAACGGDDDSSNGGALRPADEVLGERAADDAADALLGDSVELEDVTVTVTDLVVGGDDFGPWLEVTVRAENRGEDTSNPYLAIVCNGSVEEGGWQADSTYDLNGELPGGSFNEGVVNLLLPEDPRTQDPVPECATPAVVRVTMNGGFVMDGDEGSTVDYPVGDDVVAEMNARRLTE